MIVYSLKVLERKPIVMGLDLLSVIVIIAGVMLFVFTAFSNFLVSLIFLAIPGLFLYFKNTFKDLAGFSIYFKYKTTAQVVVYNQSLKTLLKTNELPK